MTPCRTPVDAEPRPGQICARLEGVRELPDPLNVTAPRQAGVVSRVQALHGLTSAQVGHLVRSGRWQRLHPGVYATFSGAVGQRARSWAALLHCGPTAVLSHESAAAEQGLTDEAHRSVHVTVDAGRRVLPQAGVVVHRSRRLASARHPARSLPQTRVEETVLDLVDTSDGLDQVVGWLTGACQRRLTTPQLLRDTASARSRLRHRRLVADVLADVADGVSSPLELRYARDVERRHGLPRGRRGLSVVVAGRRRYRDVEYEQFATNVELEGLAYHPDDCAYRDDLRDNEMVVRGAAVLRYGWRPVAGSPCVTALEVATVLAARGWQGRPRACAEGCAVTSWQVLSAG